MNHGLNLDRNKRELQPHGTPDFPCAGYDCVYTDMAEGGLPWHWHEELEVLAIEEGALCLQAPGRMIHLKAGDGVLINSNILHHGRGEPRCRVRSLVFHGILVAGSEHSAVYRKYIYPLIHLPVLDICMLQGNTTEGAHRMELIKNAICALEHSSPGYEIMVREQLSRLCLELYEQFGLQSCQIQDEISQDSQRLKLMLHVIHTRYGEDLTVSQIARAADIGERECLRCFRRFIQISPMQYVLQHRISRAASMLMQQRQASISEIATSCGFDSPSHFAQMFKRFYRCTPRQYRSLKEGQ